MSRLAAVSAVTFALLLGSNAALAEESTRAMSLPDAIRYAKAHHPAVLAGIARIGARTEEANVPRAQWQPIVEVSGQIFGATANNTTGTFVTPGVTDIPRIGATRATSSGTWQPYASTFVGAGVRQEIFDFGRIAAQSAAADALIESQRQLSKSALLDVTYSVLESYFAVLAAKGILQASEDAYQRSKAHRDLAKAGVGAGLRSPIELTRAEAELTRFDTGRIRARGGLDAAQSVYAASVGVPDVALDVTGAPQDPAEMPSLNDAVAQAEARDPRIHHAIAQLRADEQRTRAIAAETRPNLAFTGTISGRAGGAPPSSGDAANGNGWVPNVPNWDVGAVLSWPLFEPTVRARAQASRAVEEVRREELAQTRFEEVAAIRQAYLIVGVARSALPSLQQSVSAAHANYDQADARFKAGMGTAIELADAEAVRADAEIQLALGVFDLARARAVFGRTIAEGL